MTSVHHVEHAGTRIPYTIVSSARRTIGICVRREGGVVVRVPRHAPTAEIERAVASRARWVAAAVADAAARALERRYQHGSVFVYRGRPHVLRLGTCAQGGGPTVIAEAAGEHGGDGILVRVPGTLAPDAVAAALDAWLMSEARRELPLRLAACWTRFARPGEAMPSLRVRHMRSRWGSLAARRRMTLNAHLMRASDAAIDSVVFHELCHTRVDGHGPGFYAELAVYAPEWSRHRAELRRLPL